MSAGKKPTPAQRRWLIAIATGNVYKPQGSLRGMRYPTAEAGHPRKSTWTMTVELREAGWIEESDTGSIEYGKRMRVSLTAAGRAVIA